jgi:hypothetical protein
LLRERKSGVTNRLECRGLQLCSNMFGYTEEELGQQKSGQPDAS